MNPVRKTFGLAVLSIAAALGGCMGDMMSPASAIPGPHLAALATYEASVGSHIDIYGTDIPAANQGRVFVVFKGTYKGASGAEMPVDREFATRVVDTGTVRWNTFGPHAMPFGMNEPGIFKGTVALRLKADDGSVRNDPKPSIVEFKVKPSILVTEFQPLGAACASPALRGLAGLKYRIGAEAVGFQPSTMEFSISAPEAQMAQPDPAAPPAIQQIQRTGLYAGPVNGRIVANGKKVTFGENGELLLPGVPKGAPGYALNVTITGTSADGERISAQFATIVSRPVDMYYDGTVEVAEILAPVPIGSCTPGGLAGLHVTYSEDRSETRERGMRVDLSENWDRAVTTGENRTIQIGSDLQNSVALTLSNSMGRTISSGNDTSKTLTWDQGSNNDMGGDRNSSEGWNASGEVGVNLFEVVRAGGSYGRNGTAGSSENWRKGSTSSRGGNDTRTTHNNTSNEQSNSQSREGRVAATVNESTSVTESSDVRQSNGGSTSQDFSSSVSSNDSLSRRFEADIFAQHSGMFYRQTIRLQRRASVLGYNMCGRAEILGEAQMTDWVWSVELAQQRGSCPPLPKSSLPPAQCFSSPCVNE